MIVGAWNDTTFRSDVLVGPSAVRCHLARAAAGRAEVDAERIALSIFGERFADELHVHTAAAHIDAAERERRAGTLGLGVPDDVDGDARLELFELYLTDVAELPVAGSARWEVNRYIPPFVSPRVSTSPSTIGLTTASNSRAVPERATSVWRPRSWR